MFYGKEELGGVLDVISENVNFRGHGSIMYLGLHRVGEYIQCTVCPHGYLRPRAIRAVGASGWDLRYRFDLVLPKYRERLERIDSLIVDLRP